MLLIFQGFIYIYLIKMNIEYSIKYKYKMYCILYFIYD